MKKILLFACFLSLSNVRSQELTLESLTEYVSTQNYTVLEQAQRVYQSKQSIKHARNSLLPRLNVWSILKIPLVIVDPFSLGDVVQDLAPFLVPANWFKQTQMRAQAAAQEAQYLALWANELMTARLLFIELQREEEFVRILTESLNSYQRVRRIARLRSAFGADGGFALNLIDERILALEDDLRALELLYSSNRRQLLFVAGLDQNDQITLHPSSLVLPDQAPALEEELMEAAIIGLAPELQQYRYLDQALAAIRGSMRFSLLGASTFSSSGEVFSSIPVTDGLGFGQTQAINIAKSERAILELKRAASEQIIKRQFKLLAQEYRLLEASYLSAKQRYELATLNQQLLESRLRYGAEVAPLELIEALDNVAQTQILILTYVMRFNEVIEKLKRMTFTAPYHEGGGLHE